MLVYQRVTHSEGVSETLVPCGSPQLAGDIHPPKYWAHRSEAIHGGPPICWFSFTCLTIVV